MTPSPSTTDEQPSDPSTGAMLGAFVASTVLTGVAGVGGIASGSVLLLGLAIHSLGQAIEMGTAWWVGKAVRDAPGSLHARQYQRMPATVSAVTVAILVMLSAAMISWMGLRGPWTAGAFAMGGTALTWIALWSLAGAQTPMQRRATGRMLETLMLWGGAGCFLVMATGLSPYGQIADIAGGAMVFAWAWGRAGRWCQAQVLSAMAHPSGPFNTGLFNAQVRGLSQIRLVHDTRTWATDHDHCALVTHLVVTPQTTAQDIASLKQQVRQLAEYGQFDQITIEVSRTGEEL